MDTDKVFVYGNPVGGDNFIAREEEIKRVRMAFTNGVNSIIIAQRGMGKTSLLKRVISDVKGDSDIITVYVDLFDCRTEQDFYLRLASSLMEQTDYYASLDRGHIKDCPAGVLNLPQVIANKLGKRIIVCIDQFQQIGRMKDSVTIQKRLRTIWQHQQNCSYCFSGCNKHLMSNIFQSKSMPFYKFDDILYLNPIPTEDWIGYIQQRFGSRGKQISITICERICELTHNHSAYVQKLAWNVFVQTVKFADEETLNSGVKLMHKYLVF